MTPALPCPPLDADHIEGVRVDLERLDPDRHGADLWAAIGADPDLWSEIPPGPFPSQTEFVGWLQARRQIPDLAPYVIVDKSDGSRKTAGLYFLLHINPAFATCEFGLVYGPRLSRRSGGTEAFLLLARYVFATGYRRMEWRCASTHLGSQRAATRFGFIFEGLLRQTMWLKGRNWDTMLYAMIDGDWPHIEGRLTAWLAPDNFLADGRQIKPLSPL